MNTTVGKSNPARNLFDSNIATISEDNRSGIALYIETSEVYLRDVTIKNHRDANAIEIERGTKVEIVNAILRDNYAPTKGNGVIMCQSCASINIINVEAFNNKMKLGGVFALNNIAEEVNIKDSQFYNNIATLSGGVIVASGLQQDLNIENCLFTNNSAANAGVLRLIEISGSLNIIDSLFT